MALVSSFGQKSRSPQLLSLYVGSIRWFQRESWKGQDGGSGKVGQVEEAERRVWMGIQERMDNAGPLRLSGD